MFASTSQLALGILLHMETTRRKVLLLAAAIVLLLSAMLFAVFSGPREPSYEGKMLGAFDRIWLYQR